MTRKLLPTVAAWAAALAAALASMAVHAQSINPVGGASLRELTPGSLVRLPPGVRAGLPETPAGAAQGGEIRTRSNVTGNLSQSSAAGGEQSTQTITAGAVGIGGNAAVGSLRGEGTITGNIAQSRALSTAAEAGSQVVNVGSVVVQQSVDAVDARGTLTANVTQIARSTAGRGADLQAVHIGAVIGSGGGSLTTRGSVSGGGVTQDAGNAMPQTLEVGSILGVTAQSATVNGTVTAAIAQTSGGVRPGGASGQRIGVGDVRESQLGQVVTNGLIANTVAQRQASDGSGLQTLDVGSVRNVSNGGRIATDGSVLGTVLQDLRQGEQAITVASVTGNVPDSVSARGVISGGVVQLGLSTGSNQQFLHVGSVRNVAATNVTTDASVSGTVQQVNTGASRERQRILLGTAGSF